MKANRLSAIAIYSVWTAVLPASVSGHEVIVHETITTYAHSAILPSLGYSDFLGVIAPPDGIVILNWQGKKRIPMHWMVEGAGREDDIDKWVEGDAGGKRVYNHFYDPLSGEGLANFPPDTKFGRPFGKDSFTWGSVKSCRGIDFDLPKVGNKGTRNDWAWPNAREYQYLGLTAADPIAREENLAKTFRALGNVVHLIQDKSCPQHVRDEHHVNALGGPFTQWHSAMEKHGARNVHKLNYSAAMLDWRAAGFKRLRDFWDRDLYVWNRSTPATRNPQPLINHETAVQAGSSNPQDRLGLAEFANGNFIGSRHTYREIFPVTHPYHYPFPSLDDGTDFASLLQNPFQNGKQANDPRLGSGLRFIVKKDRQGRTVTHHGSVFYLLFPTPGFPNPQGTLSAHFDDPDVLDDYHSILIPEAVSYSAGAIDYFFRGRLAVASAASATPGKVGIRVTNRSGQSLNGGAFKLYYDDPAGTRTEITSLTSTYGSSLPDNASFTGEFTPPSPAPAAYFVVYKGTIGISGSTALDPVDSGIAVAAAKFTRDAFIDVVGLSSAFDLADDGSIAGTIGNTRPGYYSGFTRVARDTRVSADSAPITVSQTDNSVTASDILFTPAHVGRLIRFSSGQTATITSYVSPTQVTATPSQDVPSATILIQGATLGGQDGVALVCNGSGIVAGYEHTGNFVGFWLNTMTGDIRALPTADIWDITPDGWLLLRQADVSGDPRAVLYNPTLHTFTNLGSLAGGGDVVAVAMNAAHVVALDADALHPDNAVWWNAARWANGIMTSVHPAAAGSEPSYSIAINAGGDILGTFIDPATREPRTFIDVAGVTTLIGPSVETTSYAINNAKTVVGRIRSGAVYVPYRWTPAGGIEHILLVGATSGTAHAVNNAGDIVGEMDGIAFLYRGQTVHRLIDLITGIPGALGWTQLLTATWINDNNDIVGEGVHNGVTKTYRLHLPP